ncbi:MAG: ABC transporter permease [Bacteroidales bacterium]|nr:MAG: ABC transporter permease [Bacteroidales bacterium]
MRTIVFILYKEFLQIFRNKTMLPIIFIVPVVQLIILAHAATMEMKHIKLYVVDKDLSSTSKKLISKFEGSPFFVMKKSGFSDREAESAMLQNKTDAILHIPVNFEKKLYSENTSEVQFLIDAINGLKAGLTNAYTSAVISGFNRDILTERGSKKSFNINMKRIQIHHSYWYNPQLNFKFYIVPGILVILVSMIGLFLTALNIVREKEAGTIEQINVTPVRKYQLLTGKLIPFWIIALFDLAFGLALGKILFNIPVEGNLLLLFSFAGIYLIVFLGIGLFISTMANTQQQVMFIVFFFMITFILMSGIFTPEESMPYWAQKVNIINHLSYFMRVIRMILLKGSGFKEVFNEFISITILGIVILSLAIWRYRKIA